MKIISTREIRLALRDSLPIWLLLAAVLIIIIFFADPSYAGTSGTAFDGPLRTLRGIFTGPVAFTVSLLGILVAGVTLVFGGEIGDFAKRMVMLVLVIALVSFAAQILTQLFGNSGATVIL